MIHLLILQEAKMYECQTILNPTKIFNNSCYPIRGRNNKKNPSHAIVPLRNHFHRMTVSLGDHNVNNTHSETKNVFRKLKRIVRSDSSTEFRSQNNGLC
jgi:hypothetical protein